MTGELRRLTFLDGYLTFLDGWLTFLDGWYLTFLDGYLTFLDGYQTFLDGYLAEMFAYNWTFYVQKIIELEFSKRNVDKTRHPFRI